MKKDISFNVDIDYALSENIMLNLIANVQLHHSVPHYLITDFHLKKNPGKKAIMPDIKIMALQHTNGISWVDVDSCKETVLSMSAGKAIENKTEIEIAHSCA